MTKHKHAVSSGVPQKSGKTGRHIPAIADRRSQTSTVTAKGQITVPKPIREHLKLAKGDRIEFLVGIDGGVTIVPATADIRKLKGMVPKPAEPVTLEDMNRAIEAESGTVR